MSTHIAHSPCHEKEREGGGRKRERVNIKGNPPLSFRGQKGERKKLGGEVGNSDGNKITMKVFLFVCMCIMSVCF